MHKWLESFVTEGLSFLSLLHKYLWSCHTSPHSHTHTHTLTFLTSKGTCCVDTQAESCRSMHAHTLLKSVNTRACVHGPLCVSRYMLHDQRYLCRRDRNDNPLVTKLWSFMHGVIFCLSWKSWKSTPGADREQERETKKQEQIRTGKS